MAKPIIFCVDVYLGNIGVINARACRDRDARRGNSKGSLPGSTFAKQAQRQGLVGVQTRRCRTLDPIPRTGLRLFARVSVELTGPRSWRGLLLLDDMGLSGGGGTRETDNRND